MVESGWRCSEALTKMIGRIAIGLAVFEKIIKKKFTTKIMEGVATSVC